MALNISLQVHLGQIAEDAEVDSHDGHIPVSDQTGRSEDRAVPSEYDQQVNQRTQSSLLHPASGADFRGNPLFQIDSRARGPAASRGARRCRPEIFPWRHWR